jgi:hypothetical protein
MITLVFDMVAAFAVSLAACTTECSRGNGTNLREQLLEVIVEQRLELRQTRERRVVAHRAERLLPGNHDDDTSVVVNQSGLPTYESLRSSGFVGVYFIGNSLLSWRLQCN